MADMLKIYGLDLKALRERQNLTLKTIAQQTRLNLSILENIENGDFTFQPQAYIRAFLKQYINSLGLDMEETLFDYDLARSGKYTPKQSSYETNQEINTETPIEIATKGSKLRITEKLKEIAETPRKILEEKKTDKETETKPVESQDARREIPEKKVEHKNVLKPPEGKEQYYIHKPKEKRSFSFSFLSSPVIRNIALILFAALVFLGLYSLVNILFLEGSNDRPEVIRQNFDDVVKEQERKILGTRTPEEIQDSIRKAEELLSSSKDTIVLKVTGLNSGIFYLVMDSVNYNKPDKIEFEKGNIGTFKAHKSFFISSSKTESFRATVNDIPLKFDKSAVSKVKIDKNGIVK